MNLYNEQEAKEKIELINLAQHHGLNTVRVGMTHYLSEVLQPSSLIVVYVNPTIVIEAQQAVKEYPWCQASEFIGKLNKSKVIKRIYVGNLSWVVIFENENSWKADEGVTVNKWRNTREMSPLLPLDCFCTDTVDGKIVRVRKKFGFRSNQLSHLTSLQEIETELKRINKEKLPKK